MTKKSHDWQEYLRRLGSFFWVQNIECHYFLGVFRKMNIFWGMEILWIFFGGHHKIGLHLGSFLRVKVQNGGYFFLVDKISSIFWGNIFFGNTVDSGSEPTYEEKMRVPPWGGNKF